MKAIKKKKKENQIINMNQKKIKNRISKYNNKYKKNKNNLMDNSQLAMMVLLKKQINF